jgi:spore coat polysaccharide biosynthesis protein SpsF
LRVVAIIQARTGSTRLPGKVLRELGGKTVLARVIERARAIPGVDEVVVATTTSGRDDAIVAESRRAGAATYRGSEDDVLARYVGAARQAGAEIIIRITSDCPLLDPELIGAMLARFASEPADYLSNTVQRTFPRGLDAEILGMGALERAGHEAEAAHEREHVTPYIWQHPDEFRVLQHTGTPDRSSLRWTLDTVEDWDFLNALFGRLARFGLQPTTHGVLEALRLDPGLLRINAHVEQKSLKG